MDTIFNIVQRVPPDVVVEYPRMDRPVAFRILVGVIAFLLDRIIPSGLEEEKPVFHPASYPGDDPVLFHPRYLALHHHFILSFDLRFHGFLAKIFLPESIFPAVLFCNPVFRPAEYRTSRPQASSPAHE
jgi:hypothetical protein